MEKKSQNKGTKVQNLNPGAIHDLHKSAEALKDLGLGVIHLKDGIIYEEKTDGSKKIVGTLKTKFKQ